MGTAVTLGFVLDDLESPTLLLALAAAAYIGQWSWGPARGATVLLTFGLLSMWGFVIDAAARDTPGASGALRDTFEPLPNTSFTSGDETVAYLSLIIGGLLLLGARALDRAGWRGVATAAIIAGDVAFVVGVFGVIAFFDSDAVGAILVIAAGLALALVGATGERRFTTWLGGSGVFIGLAALIVTVFEADDAPRFGITAVAIGVAVIAVGAFVDLEPATVETPEEPSANTAATTLSEPPARPGWHPDPYGRHELRWHDGAEWTANVSDQGETCIDEGI